MEPIRVALDAGRYADAERLASTCATPRKPPTTSQSLFVVDLLVEALTKGGRIGEPSTVALAERLIADKTALFGSSMELASSLDNLGSLSTARGEFAGRYIKRTNAPLLSGGGRPPTIASSP